jgi:hypothetical protein
MWKLWPFTFGTIGYLINKCKEIDNGWRIRFSPFHEYSFIVSLLKIHNIVNESNGAHNFKLTFISHVSTDILKVFLPGLGFLLHDLECERWENVRRLILGVLWVIYDSVERVMS